MKKMLIALGMLIAVVGGLVFLLTQPTFGSSRTGPEVTVDPKALEATVRKLSVDFHPRDHTHPANLDLAAEWIRAELGPAATVQEWKVNDITFRNVSMLFGPASAERVVVGAHYDSAEGCPAANDNASGVAVLLELARTFALEPQRRTLRFVAFVNEEPPHFQT